MRFDSGKRFIYNNWLNEAFGTPLKEKRDVVDSINGASVNGNELMRGKCPRCDYERTPEDDQIVPLTECPRCGIIYEKAKRTTCTEETRETHGSVDKKLLELCENAIIYRLGGLADIPPELANTVANVYLRFFYLFHPEGIINDIPALFDKLDLQVDIDEVWLNPSGMLIETIDSFEYITESDPYLKKIRSSIGADPFTKSMSINYLTRLKGLAEFRFINAIIGYLRILNDHPQQKNTGMMVDLILDVFKYQIIRSVGKTSIRRKIERKLKKKKVFEIPNLIDLLNIRNLLKAKFFVTRKKLDEKDEEDITMDYLSPVGSFF